jgi:1-acyl-sn-glycerol-3-phosphate acyltransferase
VSGAPYLIIANHQSMFDIPLFGALLVHNFPKYVSKRELAKWIPSISYNLRRGGNALIDRDDRAGATRAIRELARQVTERGVSAVIYPEGTRARQGKLGRFRPAGALALLDEAPEIPVVVVAIDASWRLLQFNLLPIPFGVTVRVSIGAPIERHPDEDRAALLADTRSRIEKTLERWRALDAA